MENPRPALACTEAFQLTHEWPCMGHVPAHVHAWAELVSYQIRPWRGQIHKPASGVDSYGQQENGGLGKLGGLVSLGILNWIELEIQSGGHLVQE